MTNVKSPPQTAPATVDQLLQRETFAPNAAIYGAGNGGTASLINVQKDVDTLLRHPNGGAGPQGGGVTLADLKSDLVATGDANAEGDANKLIDQVDAQDTQGLKDTLASLFQSQGGKSKSDAVTYASNFVDAAGINLSTHTLKDTDTVQGDGYQSAKQESRL